MSTDQITPTHTFADRHSAWLAARAAFAAPPAGCSNEKMDQLREGVDESLRLLMQTPATAGWMVWRKLEAFESELSANDEGGNGILAECTMLFGCLKADFMRLGFRG